MEEEIEFVVVVEERRSFASNSRKTRTNSRSDRSSRTGNGHPLQEEAVGPGKTKRRTSPSLILLGLATCASLQFNRQEYSELGKLRSNISRDDLQHFADPKAHDVSNAGQLDGDPRHHSSAFFSSVDETTFDSFSPFS